MSAFKTDYPSVGFYFQVKVDDETYSFKEVSGITSEVTTEEITEGGENRFRFRVPTHVKYNNLELKRGLVPKNSNLIIWLNETIQQGFSNKTKTKTVDISLLNEERAIVMAWKFMKAWPVACNFAFLDSMHNEILIESISLSYNYFTTQTIE